jgi:ketosteroid isomerase-like protein
MQIRRLAVGSLVAAVFLASAASAQPTTREVPPVQAVALAEHALIDALLRHDRAAFQQLLTPESVFLFPKRTEGPEAIGNAWLPFLIDGGPTMVITSEGVAMSTSPDRGSSTGTFAIRGQTGTGVRTVPAGTLLISWRRINGAWKVSALEGASNGSVTLARAGGVGGFRFGMSPAEVSSVPDCQPYSNVSRTGGIECPNYTFEGHPMNISFLFGPNGLRRIQLWFYSSGESESEARDAVGRVIEYLDRTSGGVSIGGLPELKVTSDAVIDMLKTPVPAGRIAQVEISSRAGSGSEKWFARVGRHQFGFSVMLFADPR